MSEDSPEYGSPITFGQTVSTQDLEQIAYTLAQAAHDIHGHLQVAKYNLRGECCGEIIPKPNPPMLIHEDGIAVSEGIAKACRNLSAQAWKEIARRYPAH